MYVHTNVGSYVKMVDMILKPGIIMFASKQTNVRKENKSVYICYKYMRENCVIFSVCNFYLLYNCIHTCVNMYTYMIEHLRRESRNLCLCLCLCVK